MAASDQAFGTVSGTCNNMNPTDVSHINQLVFTGRMSDREAASARTALRGDTIDPRVTPHERVNLRKAGSKIRVTRAPVPRPRKPRTWIKMFQLRFVPKVADGTKRTTIRPKPQRPQDWPVVGDLIEARHWLGKPYRSKHKSIITGAITSVQLVTITVGGIIVGDPTPENTMQPAKIPGMSLNAMNRMAKADGFLDWFGMRTWFRNQHGLPFTGILIKWKVAA
jgi:hypothetical protein